MKRLLFLVLLSSVSSGAFARYKVASVYTSSPASEFASMCGLSVGMVMEGVPSCSGTLESGGVTYTLQYLSGIAPIYARGSYNNGRRTGTFATPIAQLVATNDPINGGGSGSGGSDSGSGGSSSGGSGSGDDSGSDSGSDTGGDSGSGSGSGTGGDSGSGSGSGGEFPTNGECRVGYHLEGLLCYPNAENPNDPDPDDGGSSGGSDDSSDTGGGSSSGGTDTPDPDDSGDTTDPTTPTNPNNPPDNSGVINAVNSLRNSNQSNFNALNQRLSALNESSNKVNQSIVAQMNQDKDIAQAQLKATQKQIDASDAKTDEQTGALTEAIGETGDEIGDGLASIQDKLCDPRTDPRACEGENGLTADGVLGMYEQMIEGGDKAVSAGDAAYTEALEDVVSSDKTAESQDNIQGVANLLSLPTGSRCSLETLKTPVGSFQLGCEFATFLKTLLEFVFYIGTIYYILDILFDGVTPMPGNTSSSRGGR